MRMLQDMNASGRGNCQRRIRRQAFDTNASTTVSVCDEHGGKIGHSARIARPATGAVSPLYHRQCTLRHRDMDGVDGAGLRAEHAYEQSAPTRTGPSRGWPADAP